MDIQRCEHSFQTLEGLDQLYESKRQTAKKIMKLFRGKPSTGGERQSLDYLKKFVNSLEGKALSMFQRFCTGSDVITCDSIRICFSSLEGLQRRPVARTCTPILKLLRHADLSQLLPKSLKISWRKAKHGYLTRYNSVYTIFVQRVQYFSIADMIVKRCIVNHANN